MCGESDSIPPTMAGTTRSRRLRRSVRVALGFLLLAAMVLVGFLFRPWIDGNVGVVDPGRVIRSAQPTAGLDRLIAENHLASILNLRGGTQRDSWYANEVRATSDQGVAFYDLPLSATRRPGRRELLQLVDVLERCTYPLLIHCKSGADRTGLASALYLMLHKNQPPRQAESEFTLFHSHIPLFGPERLHEPLDEYARWLDAQALPHTPARFREWVKHDYVSSDPGDDPPPLASGPRRPHH